MMHIHPIHCHEIYKARQKEREAEAWLYRIKRANRGEPTAHKLFTALGRFFTSVQIAITQPISTPPTLHRSKEPG